MKKEISEKIFSYRSYTPIPFLILMIAFAKPTTESMVVGFVIALSGELFRYWGVAYAGSETRTTGSVGGTYLVVSGAFAYVRNPLYLGNILLYTGVGIMSNALFPYLQIVAIIWFYIQYRIIIDSEEKYLDAAFGEKYESYKKSVPRLIPTLRKYKNPGIKQPPLNLKAGLRSEKRTLQAFTSVILILLIIFIWFGN